MEALPLETAAQVARAFTLFFLLINTAEQAHRVRRQRHYAGSRPGSLRWALEPATETAGTMAPGWGRPSTASRGARAHRPPHGVHPAHRAGPAGRVAELLLALDEASPSNAPALRRDLAAEVELLWLTTEVRQDRPSVLDEVSNIVWYLEQRLVPAATEVLVKLARAHEEVFGQPLDAPGALRPGSWVGGDRDGNPNVTPATTLAASWRMAHAMVTVYRRDVAPWRGGCRSPVGIRRPRRS